MARLQIPDFPDELLWRLKREAMERQVTLKELIIGRLDGQSEALVVQPRTLSQAKEPEYVVEVPPEQAVKERRKAEKRAKRTRLKQDAMMAVAVEGVPEKFMERVQQPALDHHPMCTCYRCRPSEARSR